MPGFQHVVADSRDCATRTNRRARSSVLQRRGRRPPSGRRRRCMAPALEPGDAVDQVGPQQRRRQLAAALDQHAGQAAARRAPSSSRRADRPCRARRRHLDHLDALRLQAPRARWPAPSRAEQPHQVGARGRRDQLRAVSDRRSLAVEHDADRRALVEARQAAGQLRIVGQHRADADQDRVVRGAQQLAVGARGLAGDPAALAARGRDAPVQRGRELQRRPAAGPARTRMKKPALISARLRRAPRRSSTAMPAARSAARPLPVHPRIGILDAPTTTRATPAAISASAQGGVLP